MSQNEFNEITNELKYVSNVFYVFSLSMCSTTCIKYKKYDCNVCLLLTGKTVCESDKTVYFVLISLVKLDSEAKAIAQSLPLVPCRCPSGHWCLPPRPSINTML